MMEFLVEFEIEVPTGAPPLEVTHRTDAEAFAAAKLAEEGHLVRLWNRTLPSGETRALGLYRADSQNELEGLLNALPLRDWMNIVVTPLEPHPNDPAATRQASTAAR